MADVSMVLHCMIWCALLQRQKWVLKYFGCRTLPASYSISQSIVKYRRVHSMQLCCWRMECTLTGYCCLEREKELRGSQVDSTKRDGTTGKASELFDVEFSQACASQYADGMQ